MVRRKLGVRHDSAGPSAEQDVDSKGAATVGGSAVKCPDNFLGFVYKLQNLPASQTAIRVVVCLVTQPLSIDEVSPKPLYFRRELDERTVVVALLPGVAVFQSTVDLTPLRLPSGNVIGSRQCIGPAGRQTMEHSVVSVAHRSLQVGLSRASPSC